MNIITVTYGSEGFYVRPDTTLNRDNNEYYCPDGVTSLAATVFIYAKATKAGKCVSAKFAERYYTSIGTGVQLIAGNLQDENPLGWTLARSLDNTTFCSPETMELTQAPAEYIEKINSAFEKISRLVSFRTGDYIAVELGPATVLVSGQETFSNGEKEIRIIW